MPTDHFALIPRASPGFECAITLQTAYTLNGTGLLPWEGAVRAAFEAQFATLLAQEDISSFQPAFVGARVSRK